MKVNKNIWVGKNKPYNQNSLHFPNGINPDGGTAPAPPSGGESGGESAMEYWDVSANVALLSEFALFTLWVKTSSEYGIDILSAYNLETKDIQPIAIALDRDAIIALESSKMTIGDFLEASGISNLTQFGWVRITKEQFYSLD